jgi:hypothetical protein
LTWDCVYCEFEVMGRDGACDVLREGEDGIHCFGGCSVFENDSEFGEGSSDFGKVGKEVLFSVQDRDVLEVSFLYTTPSIPAGFLNE